MRILNLLLLFCSFNLFAQQELSKAEIDQFREDVTAKANELETLQANFVQTKKMEMITDETVSHGKIFYQKPDKLKWEYKEPQDYVILLVGNELHINDAGDKSVRNTTSNKLFGKIAKLITGSVNSNLLDDTENFNFSYLKENNYIITSIVPKDSHLKQMFAEIQMKFNKENLVEKVSLIEESGDATVIEFKKMELNKKIPTSVFQP